MLICRYFVTFIIFSIAGWIFESTYCTLHDGYWQNRGFLFGPVCPIYGVGATGMLIAAEAVYSRFNDQIVWWEIFLAGYVGSFILEYATSVFLERVFHAYWWDYSNMPLNIKGRVCVPASTLFGCCALFLYYIVYPWSVGVWGFIPGLWVEIIALICMAVLAMDTALTITGLIDFDKRVSAAEGAMNQSIDRMFKGLQERTQIAAEKLADEKERFKTEGAREYIASMSRMSRMVISRALKFNYPKLPKPNLDAIMTEARKHRFEIKWLTKINAKIREILGIKKQ